MSSTTDKDMVSSCANCGKGEEESGKLKNCTVCMMVKYCNRECQVAHRPQHKKECKRRANELHDEKLFKHPPPKEVCPICFVRLPALDTGWRYNTCCGQVICCGCSHAPLYDNQGNKVDNKKCPFCRTPHPAKDDDIIKRTMKRLEVNDAKAMHGMGVYYRDGVYGLPQDYTKTLEFYHRAAELGYALAYCSIGFAYDRGRGVEVDRKKATYYYELAAMKGDSMARFNLGICEREKGNMDRALKHYMIAAMDGHATSLQEIQLFHSNGLATKEDYTKALRAYQEYVGEIKSRQRDEAAAASEANRYY